MRPAPSSPSCVADDVCSAHLTRAAGLYYWTLPRSCHSEHYPLLIHAFAEIQRSHCGLGRRLPVRSPPRFESNQEISVPRPDLPARGICCAADTTVDGCGEDRSAVFTQRNPCMSLPYSMSRQSSRKQAFRIPMKLIWTDSYALAFPDAPGRCRCSPSA